MKNLKHLFTTLLLLCCTFATAQTYEIDGIKYSLSSNSGNFEMDVTGSTLTGDITIPEFITVTETPLVNWSVGGSSSVKDYNKTHLLKVKAGDVIKFDYYLKQGSYVDSHNLTITLDGSTIFSKSTKSESGTYEYTFQEDGIHQLVFKYSFRVSLNDWGNAYVKNITINGVAKTEVEDIQIPVTKIASSAFSSKKITSIAIPNSVTSIGNNAFNGCTSLTEITIPNSVTSIEEKAFYGCTALTDVVFENCAASIGNYAFDECRNIVNLDLGNNVTSIGNYAFRYCKFTNLTIPSSTKTIGSSAFYSCKNLVKLTIGGGVTDIGMSAFNYCSSLKELYLEDGDETLKIENNGTSIIYNYDVTFINSKLESIYIGRNLSYSSLSYYGWSPFYMVKTIKTVTFGKGVTQINNKLFAGCSGITTVNSYSTIAPELGNSPFSTTPTTATLYVPEGSDYSAYATYFTINYSLQACCKVEFFIDGEKFSEAEVNYGEIITLPTAPEKEGHTFQGWENVPETMPAKDIQIHGSYKANNYTVTYIVDGEAYNTASHTYGTAVTPIEAPVKEGYTFSHWEGVPSTMPANDVEVVAVYNRIPTEVTITINEYGCGTFCSEHALDFTAVTGLKAYAAGGYNTSNGIVTVFQVNTTPAGTGLFIKGEPGSYEIPIIKDSFDHTVNLLVGTLEKTSVNATSDDNLYANFKFTILPEDEEPKFYRFADGSSLGAGKAYLQIPLSWLPSQQQRTIGIRFGNNGTTDINEIAEQNEEVVYYDLSGRKVTNPTRGIYIVNGKKVFIK